MAGSSDGGAGSSKPALSVRVEGVVAHLTLDRPDKRNALNDRLIEEIDAFFRAPPEGIRVAVMSGAGGNFSSGLDLSEHVHREPPEVMRHSRHTHEVMDRIQYGGLPVVSVLQGAVMGGGLELAAATHVRVAEPTCRFQLPEGKRGIFVGGGASVRVGRIVGADRMVEMMLTGRIYDAGDGQRLGLSHYLVGEGEGAAEATRLAEAIASNAELVNYIVIQALSRIDDMSRADGLFTESLCAGLSQTGEEAQEGLRAFLEKRKPKFS